MYRNAAGSLSSGCRPGSTLAGDPATGDGLSVAHPTQANAGTQATSGIDGRLTYRPRNVVLGGRVALVLDATYNLTNTLGEVYVFGAKINDEVNGLGTLFNVPQLQGVNDWRGGIQVNYARGRHSFAWQTRYFGSLRNDTIAGQINVPSSGAINFNPVAANRALCASALMPSVAGGANASILGPVGAGEGAYDADCNVPLIEGHKLSGIWNTDFTYRVRLPAQMTLSITVDNVFDAQPAFWRREYGYYQIGGLNALGRNVKVGVRKVF